MAPWGGVPALCGHQSSEGMSISSSFRSFPVTSEVKLWSLGVSLSLDSWDMPSSVLSPLGLEAAPRGLQPHTVLLIFLHLVCSISFVVACSSLSSFLTICLKTPQLPGEPVRLSLWLFPWGPGHSGKHAVPQGAAGAAPVTPGAFLLSGWALGGRHLPSLQDSH